VLRFGTLFNVEVREVVLVSTPLTNTGVGSTPPQSGVRDMQMSAFRVNVTVGSTGKCAVIYTPPQNRLQTDTEAHTVREDVPCSVLPSFQVHGDNTILHKVVVSSSDEKGKVVWDFTDPTKRQECSLCAKNERFVAASANPPTAARCESCYTALAVRVDRTSPWWEQSLPQPEWAIQDISVGAPASPDGSGLLRHSARLARGGFFDLTSVDIQYNNDVILPVCQSTEASEMNKTRVVLHLNAISTLFPLSSQTQAPQHWQVGGKILLFPSSRHVLSVVNAIVLSCDTPGPTGATCASFMPKNVATPTTGTTVFVRMAGRAQGV